VIHRVFSYAAQVVVLRAGERQKIDKVVAVQMWDGPSIAPGLRARSKGPWLHMGLGYALSEDSPVTRGGDHGT